MDERHGQRYDRRCGDMAPEHPVLTTQLYFPDEPANRRDALFRRDLVMRITEAPSGIAARFDFVLNIR